MLLRGGLGMLRFVERKYGAGFGSQVRFIRGHNVGGMVKANKWLKRIFN
jgi:hypothetical protein